MAVTFKLLEASAMEAVVVVAMPINSKTSELSWLVAVEVDVVVDVVDLQCE
jgi:hypothetical protein